jgi:hypothetical protein
MENKWMNDDDGDDDDEGPVKCWVTVNPLPALTY